MTDKMTYNWAMTNTDKLIHWTQCDPKIKYKCLDRECIIPLIKANGKSRKYLRHSGSGGCVGGGGEGFEHSLYKHGINAEINSNNYFHIYSKCIDCKKFIEIWSSDDCSKSVSEYHYDSNNKRLSADIGILNSNGNLAAIIEIEDTHATEEGSRPEPWFQIPIYLQSQENKSSEYYFRDTAFFCNRPKNQRQCNHCKEIEILKAEREETERFVKAEAEREKERLKREREEKEKLMKAERDRLIKEREQIELLEKAEMEGATEMKKKLMQAERWVGCNICTGFKGYKNGIRHSCGYCRTSWKWDVNIQSMEITIF